MTGLYRHELPRLPEVVVRETIANAVAHRSYESHGTAVVVEMRPDEVIVALQEACQSRSLSRICAKPKRPGIRT